MTVTRARRLALLLALAAAPLAASGTVGPDTPVEFLLGRHGREQLAHQLEQRSYGGRSYPWTTYAAWGRELLVRGSVASPPIGPAPSARLSASYRCVHCHSLVREDPRPGVQDPDAREALLRAMAPSHPEVRDGSLPLLLPGTTFHGIVNRTSFYNGYYEKYRRLKEPDGSRMNPERLQDAVQICSRFCSVGRYLEPWEMDSVLAAFYEIELRMKDLDLTPEEAALVAAALAGADEAAIREARGLVRSSFLSAAKAELLEKPRDLTSSGDVYDGGRVVAGDPARGALVFRASCGGCHGGDVAAPPVSKLARRAREDGGFARPPTRGTERLGGLYMPLFSAQRLSARQLADVRAWLAKDAAR